MSTERSSDRLDDLSALVGGLAHELKNPLSTMNINLQLLREDWTAEETPLARRSVRKVDVLLQESRRLERMLADLLRLTSTAELDLTPVDLNQILEDVLTFTATELRNKNINVVSQFDRSLPLLRLDENLLRQAVLNVIKNAAEALEAPGGTLTIHTLADGDDIRVDVIDTGAGMSQKTFKQAFSVYYSTKREGTGLGLPMVKRILERHEGRVVCESVEGLGTKFSLLLPLSRRVVEDASDDA